MAENLPTKGLFVDANLQALFVANIDQLIADLGYPVKMFFEPSASGCPNCFRGPDGDSNGVYTDTSNPFGLGRFNIAFPAGGRCPVCQGTNEILTESSITFTALLLYEPKEFIRDATGRTPDADVQTKMQLCAIEDIRRAKKALIEGELYALVDDPTKTGLQLRSHVLASWKKIS